MSSLIFIAIAKPAADGFLVADFLDRHGWTSRFQAHHISRFEVSHVILQVDKISANLEHL